MKAIYLDAFSGISGNMLLGAFLQAGVPLAYLRQELAKLPLPGEYELTATLVAKQGIRAQYVEVKLAADEEDASTPPCGPQGQHHDHHHHHHRTLQDIEAMIVRAPLSARVQETAQRIFSQLAEAEGAVHGQPKEAVAFHEVGAVDSIVDIVGTAICLDYFGIEQVLASRLNVGSGFVRCAHGLMPVPAPAVAELLRQWPTYAFGAEEELTTPTGAAVVRALAEPAPALPEDFSVSAIGYGAGTRDLPLPNVLRLYVGERAGGSAEETPLVLSTNIDDMNPEIYGYLFDRLLAAGALDVWVTPIYMKKNRPAHELTVLVPPERRADCTDIIFRETTSIGLRVTRLAERIACDRRVASVETRYGTVRVKAASWQGKIATTSPEYEDCRRLAEAQGVPLKDVYAEARRALAFRLGEA